MSNPNFVSDLVAMAKAFEELPEVKADLEQAKRDLSYKQDHIQRLELRLIEAHNETQSVMSNLRKVEVERDHAERMFLETDDRLNAFRRLVQAFDTDVKSLVQAAEPEPEVQVATSPVQGHGDLEADAKAYHAEVGDPGPAIGGAFEDVGQSEPHPTDHGAATTTNHAPASSEHADTGVSVQPDPTQATESSSESGSSGSTQNEKEWASRHGYPTQHEEAPHPVDPTASSTAGDGASSETATPTTIAEPTTDASLTNSSPTDDVGYHNEPKIVGTGAEAWAEWDKWCERMNHRYPHSAGGWPPRTQAAQ